MHKDECMRTSKIRHRSDYQANYWKEAKRRKHTEKVRIDYLLILFEYYCRINSNYPSYRLILKALLGNMTLMHSMKTNSWSFPRMDDWYFDQSITHFVVKWSFDVSIVVLFILHKKSIHLESILSVADPGK